MRQSCKLVVAWAALLLVCALGAAAGDPLERIAPGLTASGLCPLARSNPGAAIDAIAKGSNEAYNRGEAAQQEYAGALGAAVVAANANGCINDVFEIVNQAIIKGGYPTEVVVGRALAAGTAQGVDSDTGEVLAKATAVVICRGGESASACARAWAQAIKMDKNGCLVLVKAYAHAKAQCGPGYATSQVKATVFKEPLGVCNAPGLYDNPPPASNPAPAQSQGWSVNQGAWGQSVNGGGISISQGMGGQSVNGWGTFYKWGRKLKGASVASWYGGANANANSVALNQGYVGGDMISSANAAAFGRHGGPASATANSAAINQGYVGGNMVASSNAVAYGRKLRGIGSVVSEGAVSQQHGASATDASASIFTGVGRMLKGASVASWYGGANANANSALVNQGFVGGDMISSANAAAFGQHGGPASATANSAAINQGYVGGNMVASSNAVAYGH